MQLVLIPFILAGLLCLIPAKRKTTELLLSSLAIVLIISLFAFNNQSVDQFAYKVLYTDNSYFPVEKGYLVLTNVFSFFGCDYAMFKLTLGIIFVALLYLRFAKYNAKGFRIALLVYFLSSFCFDAEQSRFTFAATIVVLGSFLLEKRGIGRSFAYLAVVALASTIHTSCIFYALLLLIKVRAKTLLSIGVVFCLITVLIGVFKIDISFVGEILYSIIPNERILMWFEFETNFGWIGPLAVQLIFYALLELSKNVVLNSPDAKLEHKELILFAYKICLVMFVATPLYYFATDFIRLIRIFFILYLCAITTAFCYASPIKKGIIAAFLASFPFLFAAQGTRGLLIFNTYYASTLVEQNEIMDNLIVVVVGSIVLFAILYLIESNLRKSRARIDSYRNLGYWRTVE